MSTNITPKQLEVLRVIVAGNADGTHADLDQVIERVSYDTTKQSIQFVVRGLIGRDLIFRSNHEVRRGRRRVTLIPTDLGKHYAKAWLAPSSFVHSADEDELLTSLEDLD